MSLETPDRLAAYLRLNVPDVSDTPNVLVTQSSVNIAGVALFDVDDIIAGINVIFTNKISRAQGSFFIQQSEPTAEAGFGPIATPVDPFFDVDDGDWTTNGDLPVEPESTDLLTLAISWFQGPLLT